MFDLGAFAPTSMERRFEMSVIGNAGLPAGMAGIHQAKKAGCCLDIEGLWLGDKFLRRADSSHELESS